MIDFNESIGNVRAFLDACCTEPDRKVLVVRPAPWGQVQALTVGDLRNVLHLAAVERRGADAKAEDSGRMEPDAKAWATAGDLGALVDAVREVADALRVDAKGWDGGGDDVAGGADNGPSADKVPTTLTRDAVEKPSTVPRMSVTAAACGTCGRSAVRWDGTSVHGEIQPNGRALVRTGAHPVVLVTPCDRCGHAEHRGSRCRVTAGDAGCGCETPRHALAEGDADGPYRPDSFVRRADPDVIRANREACADEAVETVAKRPPPNPIPGALHVTRTPRRAKPWWRLW